MPCDTALETAPVTAPCSTLLPILPNRSRPSAPMPPLTPAEMAARATLFQLNLSWMPVARPTPCETTLPITAAPMPPRTPPKVAGRSEEHMSELQSRQYLVCRLLLEKKNNPLI